MSGISKKAIKERNFRKRKNDRKRFEKPLRVFIEHKYKTIYEEYQQLYDLMVTNHPNKRNLVNTKTFKDWKRANEGNPKASDILSVAVAETLGEYVTGEQPDVASLESEQSVASEQPDVASLESEQSMASEQPDVASLESEQSVASEQPDVASLESEQSVASEQLAVANLESEQPDVVSLGGEGANDIVDIERQIDQIVNELMQEEELRGVLEMENDDDDDEGIEISVWDELALDIEPFDYELEVEGVDW